MAVAVEVLLAMVPEMTLMSMKAMSLFGEVSMNRPIAEFVRSMISTCKYICFVILSGMTAIEIGNSHATDKSEQSGLFSVSPCVGLGGA